MTIGPYFRQTIAWEQSLVYVALFVIYNYLIGQYLGKTSHNILIHLFNRICSLVLYSGWGCT